MSFKTNPNAKRKQDIGCIDLRTRIVFLCNSLGLI